MLLIITFNTAKKISRIIKKKRVHVPHADVRDGCE